MSKTMSYILRQVFGTADGFSASGPSNVFINGARQIAAARELEAEGLVVLRPYDETQTAFWVEGSHHVFRREGFSAFKK